MSEEHLPSPEGQSMLPAQRREMIIRRLRREQTLSVTQLTEIFNCSHMTVRRDIAVLEQEGLVFSVPGGVRLASQSYSEPNHHSRVIVDAEQKQRMAVLAAQMLKPGMVVYLDAGTTTLCLVPHIIALSDMTVITNDFSIVMALAEARHVKTIHTGGVLDHDNITAIGTLAADTLRNLATDIAFISSSSWDLQRGITTFSEAKVEVKKAAMAGASRVVLMATSSKYGTFAMYRIAGLERFDPIISDSGLTSDSAAGIRRSGIELVLA
ncbi:DeoR/GlpR family DNA-binding transcription regulator [Pseudomonas sp. NPDC090202]|uniref:DeoR/GlpR family DNA-binding transcription regulator n=1 Tax=unclassified Pseudomonas TaxID=196821 RepID=UPI0037FACC18